jgi:hypothetical protein
MTLSKEEQDKLTALTLKLADECWPDIKRVRASADLCAANVKNEPQLRDLFLVPVMLPGEKIATIRMENPSLLYYNPAWTKQQTDEVLADAVERAVVLYMARMLDQYEERYEAMNVPDIVTELMKKPIPDIEVVRKNRGL